MKQVNFLLVIGVISLILSDLYFILPQMSGWIKYFKYGGKNMSFKIEDDEVYLKYNQICDEIKKMLGDVKFYSEPNL